MIGFRMRRSTFALAASVAAARFTWTSYVALFAVVDFAFVFFGIVFNLSLKNVYFVLN